MIPNTRFEDPHSSIFDFASYQEYIHGVDNREGRERILKNLPIAIEEELSERERQVVIMRFYKNMRVTDIAKELGITKSAVSKTLNRAISRLFKCLRYSL